MNADQEYALCDPLNLDFGPTDAPEVEPMMFDVRVGRDVPMSEILKGIPEPDETVLNDPRWAMFRIGVTAGLDDETRDRFIAEMDREVDEHCAICAAAGVDDGLD